MSEIVGEIYEKAEKQALTGKDILKTMFADLRKVSDNEGLYHVYIHHPKKAKSLRGFRKQIRVYAIKDDLDRYYITGSALKMSHWMNKHPDTLIELTKLRIADKLIKEDDEE